MTSAEMHTLWPTLTEPLLRAAGARDVVEIGVAAGEQTRLLVQYCRAAGGFAHGIDPQGCPQELDADGRTLRLYKQRSVDALPMIERYDAVLIDGDHNWYTVSAELALIDAHARKNGTWPLVLLHDLNWPYARRDMYYDPSSVPETGRLPGAVGGVAPGRAEILERGGLNPTFHHAQREGGERNGVRTAVEDFLRGKEDAWDLTVVDGLHGLGVLCPRALRQSRPALADLLDRLRLVPPMDAHLRMVEEGRVAADAELSITKATLQSTTDLLQTSQRDIEQAVADALQKTAEATESAGKLERARSELRRLVRSRSWRWTAPMREGEQALKQAVNAMGYAAIGTATFAWRMLGSPAPGLARRIRHRWLARLWPVRYVPPAPGVILPPSGAAPRGISRTAVVIPCHNYGRFLAEAIESALHQTLLPADVLVVDDASDDDTAAIAARYADRGVRYLRGEWHTVAEARNRGAATTTHPYLVFLDADDRLAPDYIERCEEAMADPTVAIAYGDMQEFGESTLLRRMPAFDRLLLERTNYISSHAMIRRQALDLVGGYRELHSTHHDWDLYRRILAFNWNARKVETHVSYRVHADSMIRRYLGSEASSFCRSASLLHNPVTIFTPLAGRAAIWPRYLEALRALDFDHDLLRLHCFDTSGDPAFEAQVRGDLAGLRFGRVTYSRAPLPELWRHTPKSLIENRVHDGRGAQYYYEMAVVYAYSHFLRSCDTEFALVLEDDVLPGPDALRQMLEVVDSDTVAVVAHYPCHIQGHSMVWRRSGDRVTHFPSRRTGVEQVDGSGFGCSLIRMSALKDLPIQTRVFERPPKWYDYLAFFHLGSKGKILCHWGVDAEHVRTERFLKGPAPNS